MKLIMKKITLFIVVLMAMVLTIPINSATNWSKYRIMLDPGHGGKDPGASGPSAPHEATLVLRCGLALRNRIVNECGGTVKMTRETDEFIDLSVRKAASVSYDPYIFCSLHLNAYNGTAKGTETYYYWTTGNSSLLANKVQPQLIANFKKVSGFTPTDRGVKTASYTVLTGSSSVPAILTEGLFVDNSTEWNIINSEDKDGFKKWVQGHLYGFYDRLVLLNSDIINPATVTPSWTVSPTSINLSCKVGESKTNVVTINGSNLTATPTYTISGTGFSVSSKSLSATGGTITVKYAPTTEGSHSGTLKIVSGSLTQTVTLKGTATVAPLELTEVWNLSDKKGNLSEKGWNAGAVRNMTYNNGKLYLVYNHSDIKVVNAQTGADLGNLNKAGVEGGTLTLCDVKCCDGKIVATNLALSGDALRVYVWDDDQKNPRLLLETTDFGGATRIGDCIGFYGTWEDGKLVYGHFADDATRIVEYKITNSKCATIPNVINVTTDGSTQLNTGSTNRVYPDATGYWIEGKNCYATRLNTSGVREFDVDSDESWGTAFEVFKWKGNEYALATIFNPKGVVSGSQTEAKNYTGGRMKLLKKGTDWSTVTNCGEYPSAGLSDVVQNTNCTTNAIASVNGSDGVEAWVLSTGQGIAYYKFGTAPVYDVEAVVPIVPTIEVSAKEVSLKTNVGEEASSEVSVTGKDLAGDIELVVTGTDSDKFTVDVETIAKATKTATVTVTYSPTVAGEHRAILNISSANAESVSVELLGTAEELVTGIENVLDKTKEIIGSAVEYYNLQGVRVMKPEKGVYIKRQGSKVEKVIF